VKIHTDTITADDVKRCARGEGMYVIDGIREGASRTHARGLTFYLASPKGRRASAHDSLHRAASYDQWGWFFSALFELDPDGKLGPYDGHDDFHNKTEWEFT
jgi:hypothetical protein